MPANTPAPPVSESTQKAGQGDFPAGKYLFGVLLAYFALHVVLRVLISPSADLDEADQLVLTQKWSWGYGPQPPLYTWIQILFFNVFGLSIFSLALMKNLLLLCTYLLTYLNARFITRSHVGGVVAAVSLLFIPQVVWESQRDLTHSVLAATLASATVFAFFRLGEKPATARYLLFGICAGLGLISKYNYALLIAGLVLAAISMREFRSVILDRRIFLAGIIAALIFLPNGLWIAHHQALAFQSAAKFQIKTSQGWLAATGSGLLSLTISTLTFIGPLAVVLGLVFWRPRTAGPSPSRYTRLLMRLLLVVYGMIVLSVLVVGVRDIRDRWLQPILICAPVLAAALFQHRVDRARLKQLLAIGATVMVTVSVCLPGRIIFAETLHRLQPPNEPYDAIAREARHSIDPVSAVVTDTELLAGNLRLNIPGKIFTSPALAEIFLPPTGPYLLMWNAMPPKRSARGATASSELAGPLPPRENLREFAGKMGVTLDDSRALYFGATYKFYKTKEMQVGAIPLP